MSNSAFIEFILMANSGQNTAKTQRREQKKFKLHILGDSKFILKKTIGKNDYVVTANTRGGFMTYSALLWARGQDAFLIIRGT